MSPTRKLLLASLSVFALYGVQACTSETELNPQPLPPDQGEGRGPTDSESNGDGKDGTPSGSGGTTNPPPSIPADAGTEGGDASDGGPG